MKNNYRLIVVDLSGQKELDPDLNGIMQIVFVGELRNADEATFNNESMFVLPVLEKIKEATLTFYFLKKE